MKQVQPLKSRTATASKLHVLRPQQQPAGKRSIQRMAIQTADGIRLIALTDIHYIKAEGNYSMLFTAQHERHLMSKTLKYYATRLEHQGFIRSHQSYLVNVESIVGMTNRGRNELSLTNNTSIPVSRRHQAEIKNYLLTQFSI